VRELDQEYMPINPQVINYALKLVGRTMSTNCIKKWIRHYMKDK